MGDTGLETIYRDMRGSLLRFLTARTGDAAEAEDVLQKLWIKLHAMPTGTVAHGRAYLYRMAQNLVVDRLRARQRRARRERVWIDERDGPGSNTTIEPVAQDRNAEDALLEREEAALLASAVANLPSGARRAFELHKMQGLSHAEVAATLGISRSGVEKHMMVAMKYLCRALLD